MARKFCPACNKLNAGSATRCRCGHEFAASTIAQPRTTKHCRAWIIVPVGGIALAGRGFFTRADARAELRTLRAVAGVLPSAKVVRRPE